MLILLPLKIEVSSECNLQCFYFFFFSGEPFLPKMQVAFLLCFFLLFYNLNKKEGGRLLYSTSVTPFKESFLFFIFGFFPCGFRGQGAEIRGRSLPLIY